MITGAVLRGVERAAPSRKIPHPHTLTETQTRTLLHTHGNYLANHSPSIHLSCPFSYEPSIIHLSYSHLSICILIPHPTIHLSSVHQSTLYPSIIQPPSIHPSVIFMPFLVARVSCLSQLMGRAHTHTHTQMHTHT